MSAKIDKALDFVFSSKTLVFIFMMTLLLFVGFVVFAVCMNLGLTMPVEGNDLVEVWKWATGFGTGRNVISDGVMPRIPQTVGAVRNPEVSVQSPVSMKLSDPPVGGQTQPNNFVITNVV